MRAKHLGLHQAASNVPEIGSSNAQSSLKNQFSVSNGGVVAPAIQFTKKPVINSPQVPEYFPEDNYEISDKDESDDDDDDSESDASDSSKRKKPIPLWAQKSRLLHALETQFSQEINCYVDPDELFGEVETCNLGEIFGSPRKNARYQRRASTGIWTKDRVTVEEKIAYKQEHKMRLTKQY